MDSDDRRARSGRNPAPATSASPKTRLEELGVAPSKARGQNFLHDAGVIRRIADLTLPGDDNLVVEIGPGLGALTRELDQRGATVVAIEVDPRLAENLRQEPFSDRIQIVEADALAIDAQTVTSGKAFTLVGNLPYSVATTILQHFLDQPAVPRRIVAMVQFEVAKRMVARPPQMSVLSVAMQFYGQPSIAMRIGSGAFVPAPTIESAVITMDVDPVELLGVRERQKLFWIVRSGFSQRRKRLSNALASSLTMPKTEIERIVASAAVDRSRRAETLTVSEWLRLYHAFGATLDAIHES